MRFGVQIEPQFGFSYNDVREISDKALENGCEVVWFSDHFMLDADATDKILLELAVLMICNVASASCELSKTSVLLPLSMARLSSAPMGYPSGAETYIFSKGSEAVPRS